MNALMTSIRVFARCKNMENRENARNWNWSRKTGKLSFFQRFFSISLLQNYIHRFIYFILLLQQLCLAIFKIALPLICLKEATFISWYFSQFSNLFLRFFLWDLKLLFNVYYSADYFIHSVIHIPCIAHGKSAINYATGKIKAEITKIINNSRMD